VIKGTIVNEGNVNALSYLGYSLKYGKRNAAVKHGYAHSSYSYFSLWVPPNPLRILLRTATSRHCNIWKYISQISGRTFHMKMGHRGRKIRGPRNGNFKSLIKYNIRNTNERQSCRDTALTTRKSGLRLLTGAEILDFPKASRLSLGPQTASYTIGI
jgi:hypothetical protein